MSNSNTQELMETQVLYDKITTTLAINMWSLSKHSGKKKIAIEYDDSSKEDKCLLKLLYVTRHFGHYPKIYLKMPFFEYLKYAYENRKFKRTFGYCFNKKNKYIIEKEKLITDVKKAYEVNDDKIIEKIYDEFYGKEEVENDV